MAKLCSVCVKSDILCSGCSKKLEKGEISKTDIAVSRTLAKIGVDPDFIRAFEDDRSIIVLVSGDAGKMIGRGGKNTKQLTQILGKEVRIIEKSDNKQMIEKIARTTVIGINIIYGSTEKYRIRMHRTRQRVSTELLAAVLGKNVEVVFE